MDTTILHTIKLVLYYLIHCRNGDGFMYSQLVLLNNSINLGLLLLKQVVICSKFIYLCSQGQLIKLSAVCLQYMVYTAACLRRVKVEQFFLSIAQLQTVEILKCRHCMSALRVVDLGCEGKMSKKCQPMRVSCLFRWLPVVIVIYSPSNSVCFHK